MTAVLGLCDCPRFARGQVSAHRRNLVTTRTSLARVGLCGCTTLGAGLGRRVGLRVRSAPRCQPWQVDAAWTLRKPATAPWPRRTGRESCRPVMSTSTATCRTLSFSGSGWSKEMRGTLKLNLSDWSLAVQSRRRSGACSPTCRARRPQRRSPLTGHRGPAARIGRDTLCDTNSGVGAKPRQQSERDDANLRPRESTQSGGAQADSSGRSNRQDRKPDRPKLDR